MSNSLLKRTLVVSALVAVAGATAVAPAQAGGSYHDEPDNIAHHGAAGEAPENTLAAIDLALDQDADFVEVEVQRTSDGKLVAFEDITLARTTNAEEVFPERNPWFISDFTLAELRQLDAGSWFGPEFAGERIPTLREVIREVTYRDGLLIDITNPGIYPGIEADILEELSADRWYFLLAQRLGTIVVQSWDAESARTFSTLAPAAVPVGAAYGYRPGVDELTAVSEWADFVSVFQGTFEDALVGEAHGLGLDVNVHTVNTPAQMDALADLGVDGIVTDFPAVLDDVLD
ncbi:glycerophosphodiester phosphodiesterase [Jiangella alkaliphila]|uniref:Glycerophosphoryl diester phosphodiesterase n=1 Tax=Jiangella alkaliphila TaxID=419479 RepID=A0A1H2LKX0_9ACTN|nr:glycerophosphodiester phosphodiesterase family protein [Jiangella alkaliphila]SDU81036.1 glycerophosphoryl diester phosphodiesterase [Jiangella alkaliphila]